MGTGTYMQIIGALEVLAMLSAAGLVGMSTRRSTRRRILAILVACFALGCAAWSTRYVSWLRDWVYVPLKSLYVLIRYRH